MKDTEASATAQRVLQGLLFTATRPSTAHLVSLDARHTAHRLMARLPGGLGRLKQLQGVSRYGLPILERALVPGISLHYALRKRWIEERVRGALQEGMRTIVNLGAGMDTLLIRLAKRHQNLKFIEVDHPASQALKKSALQGEGLDDNFSLLSVDFSKETLSERLPENPLYEPEVSTLVIVEGVLAYLSEEETVRLFRSLRELFPRGLIVLFTFLAVNSPTGRAPYGPLLNLYLRTVDEGVKFQMDPGPLEQMLFAESFQITHIENAVEVLERYGAPHYRGAIHDLELFAEARLAGPGPGASGKPMS